MSWERVADLDALPVGQPVLVELAEPVCVVRTGEDAVHAVHNVCSHQYYELHEGFVDDCHIECALHGSSFDLRTGQPDSLPAVAPIPTYAAKIADGGVWVDADQATNDAVPPRH